MADCVIVVPCYNEEKRLRVADIRNFLEHSTAFRFLFVNDGSKDGTLRVLRAMQATLPSKCEVLDCPQNQGKAEAVRRGLLRAAEDSRASIIGYWDADLATPLAELPRLHALFKEKATTELLLGSRVKLLGRPVTRKAFRHYSGRIFATLASITLGLPIYDTQCGAKLLRNSPLVRRALAQPFLSRWIFDVELIARLVVDRRDAAVAPAELLYEEPLREWTDVGGSKLKPSDALVAIYDLLKVRRRYFA